MTHVVQDGAREAPPLLLIHGSGAASGCWDPMVPALAAHHHVIRVDLPGCGQSPSARSYAVPDQAAAVAEVPELTGEVVPLSDVWGRDADRFEERLHAAGSWDERFAIVTALLAARAPRRPVDAEVAHAWRRTVATRGRLRVDGLAGEVGWSRKRLWSRFRSQLGISPKQAARLVRFDHAAHLAAGVAVESGYADQSHLHREVREFAGLTPAAAAVAPWLTIDDVAWPATRVPRRGAGR